MTAMRYMRAFCCGLTCGILSPDSLWRAGVSGLLLSTAFFLNEEMEIRRERAQW